MPCSHCRELGHNYVKCPQLSREQIKDLISYETKINRHNALDDSIELIDLFTILVKLNNDDGFLQAKQ